MYFASHIYRGFYFKLKYKNSRDNEVNFEVNIRSHCARDHLRYLTYIDVSVHRHFQSNNPMESTFGFVVCQLYVSYSGSSTFYFVTRRNKHISVLC